MHRLNNHSALLVIDVQQGLCEGDEASFESERVINQINLVADKARRSNAVVIFIQHESESDCLVYSSRKWQLANGLRVESSDLKVRKTTPDSFLGTELQNILDQNSITNLVICGMHTEFCVDTTTRRALATGYPVVLVADGHSTCGNGYLSPVQIIQHHNICLSNISSFGPTVKVISSNMLDFQTRTQD